MKNDEIQKIKVDASKKSCKLKPGEYYIKKGVSALRPGKSFFFASKDQKFKHKSGASPTDWMNQYENQIGYSFCSKGWIGKVEVNDAKDLDARNCGMGTVFTILCMIDSELNNFPSANIDFEFGDDPDTAKVIKEGCRKLLGLLMEADPLTGAYGYFNAALKTSYNKFLIKTDKGKNLWMDTEKAKECYDDKTGKIGEGITGYSRDWWFCEEIPGEFPKLPSPDLC